MPPIDLFCRDASPQGSALLAGRTAPASLDRPNGRAQHLHIRKRRKPAVAETQQAMPKPFSKTCIASGLPPLVRQAAFRKARRGLLRPDGAVLDRFRGGPSGSDGQSGAKYLTGRSDVPDRRWGPSFVARMMPRRAKRSNSREKEYALGIG